MFFGLIISILITGQGSEKAPDQKADSILQQEDVQTIDPFSYTYNPFGKRDPFESYLKQRSEEEAPKSSDPLLNYDLSKFKLSGVVYGMANPRAIVLDGDGHGHIIRTGTRIGRNRGRVMRILKDRVVVTEQFRDPLGKLIVTEYSMKLSNEK